MEGPSVPFWWRRKNMGPHFLRFGLLVPSPETEKKSYYPPFIAEFRESFSTSEFQGAPFEKQDWRLLKYFLSLDERMTQRHTYVDEESLYGDYLKMNEPWHTWEVYTNKWVLWWLTNYENLPRSPSSIVDARSTMITVIPLTKKCYLKKTQLSSDIFRHIWKPFIRPLAIKLNWHINLLFSRWNNLRKWLYFLQTWCHGCPKPKNN